MCCTSGVYGFVTIIVFSTLLADAPNVPIALIIGTAAIYFPFMSLSGAIEQRLAEIDRRLPYTIDLLVLSMNAGLDFMSALDRVVTRGQEQNPDDPMIQELGVVLQEMRVGTPKADALLNLCERVKSEYLKSMVGAIIQSEKRGSPLAKVLEVQVDTIRNKRTQRIEKAASQAAVKILMPLMFIFGAVIVVVVGAMILKIKGDTG
jgi:tight adherence protein C